MPLALSSPNTPLSKSSALLLLVTFCDQRFGGGAFLAEDALLELEERAILLRLKLPRNYDPREARAVGFRLRATAGPPSAAPLKISSASVDSFSSASRSSPQLFCSNSGGSETWYRVHRQLPSGELGPFQQPVRAETCQINWRAGVIGLDEAA